MKFFDPLCALNKGTYKAGAESNFSLGALSLDLKLATSEPVRITNSETAAKMR